LELRTNAGGVLHIGADFPITVPECLDIAPGSAGEPLDVIRCRARLADDEGGLWEAVTHFTPEVFLEAMAALLPGEHPRFAEGKERTDEPLLAGIRGLFDDGCWRHFLVGEWAVSICFRNQRPRFTLFGDRWSIEVRASGLVGYRRAIDLENDQGFMTWKREQPPGGLREQELPPITFAMSYADLLLRNTTFAIDDGFWHRNDLAIPIVFERLDETGAPQEGVTFRPDAADGS
jgi:hypothetical protein